MAKPSAVPAIVFAASCNVYKRQAQDWAQTLAAGKDAVAHRAVDGMGQRLGRGQESFEGRVGEGDARGKQGSNRGIHQVR